MTLLFHALSATQKFARIAEKKITKMYLPLTPFIVLWIGHFFISFCSEEFLEITVLKVFFGGLYSIFPIERKGHILHNTHPSLLYMRCFFNIVLNFFLCAQELFTVYHQLECYTHLIFTLKCSYTKSLIFIVQF